MTLFDKLRLLLVAIFETIAADGYLNLFLSSFMGISLIYYDIIIWATADTLLVLLSLPSKAADMAIAEVDYCAVAAVAGLRVSPADSFNQAISLTNGLSDFRKLGYTNLIISVYNEDKILD